MSEGAGIELILHSLTNCSWSRNVNFLLLIRFSKCIFYLQILLCIKTWDWPIVFSPLPPSLPLFSQVSISITLTFSVCLFTVFGTISGLRSLNWSSKLRSFTFFYCKTLVVKPSCICAFYDRRTLIMLLSICFYCLNNKPTSYLEI